MSETVLRSFDACDESAVLVLLERTLGWRADEEHRRFFRWKHTENPFGSSPAWVAEHDGQIVGFRTFMRWEFVYRGRTLPALRAVDTATDPSFRRRGVFSALTRLALDELRGDRAEFVFNTPNGHSRPGYLRAGWQPLGRPSLRLRIRSVAPLLAVARARASVGLLSLATDVGVPASELHDRIDARLFGADRSGEVLATPVTNAFLAWRYGLERLHYRAVEIDAKGGQGVVVFRLRRRGPTVELLICDVLPRRIGGHALAALVTRVLRETKAHYAVSVATPGAPGPRGLPTPGQGTLVVIRPLSDTPTVPFNRWALTLSDLELF